MIKRKYRIIGISILFFLVATSSIFAQEDCNDLIQSAIEAADKNDYVTSLELLSKAKGMAENRHLSKERFKILNIIGVNQAKMLNYNDALESFLEAYKIASKELDEGNEMSIMNNIAGLYLMDHKYDKANEYYKKVYEYVKHTKDTLFMGGCIMNIVLTASYMYEVEEAERFLDIASKILQNYPDEMLRVKSLKICNLRQKGDFKQAERVALELLPSLRNMKDRELKTGIILELVEVYRAEGRTDEAIHYAKQALEEDINIENKRNIFDLLSDLYKKEGVYKEAVLYKDSFVYATDSLNKINNEKRFENSRIKFELLKNEKKLSDSQAKLKIMWIVFIFSGLMAVTLIWAFVNKSARDKQRKKIVEFELRQEKNDKLLLENKLKEQETLALLEQERLQHEIELKNKELISKALFLANRNELIGNLVNSFSELQDLPASPKLKDNIRQLKNQLKENGEWDSFTTHFEQNNQRFISALREKHPDLKSNEVRFLSFVYINLNTKEISSLLNITPEYCKKKKQQISKKLGLENTTLLYNYLFSL